MDALENLAKIYAERIKVMQGDLAPLKEGRMHMGANDGSGWRDTTAEWIAETERRIADLQRLIDAIAKRRGV